MIMMAMLSILGLTLGSTPVAFQRPEEITDLEGVLEHASLEGGAWILRSGGLVFDLHGDLGTFWSGDRVHLRGRVLRDKVCIHQVGILFRMDSIERLPQDSPCAPPVGPGTSWAIRKAPSPFEPGGAFDSLPGWGRLREGGPGAKGRGREPV